MSTAQKTLIDAIRRIALDSEALTSALGALQKRGVIDGIKTTLGGYNELQDDCCTDEDGNPDDPSDEKDPIDEDAPPEVPDIGDEDGDGESEWTDCETGQPITFTPGGFPRPETCKGDPVCEYEDPTYSAGTYWQTNGGSVSKSAIQAAKMDNDKFYSEGSGYFYGIRGGPDSYVMLRYIYAFGGYLGATTTYVVRYTCGDNPTGIFAKVCSGGFDPSCVEYTENGDIRPSDPAPPLWESDRTTNYTLANGCIVASSCDPDASAQAQQCNECITICNEDGQERRVCAIGNGQWILYDPTGQYKGGRYDATGRRLEILDKGETGGYLPSERFTQG